MGNTGTQDTGGPVQKTGDTLTGALVPSINNSINFGAAAFYWASVFATRLNVNSTAYLDGATAGVVALNGSLTISSTTNPGIMVGTPAVGGYFKLGDALLKKQPGGYFSFNNDGVQGINNLSLGQDSVNANVPLSVLNSGTVGNSTTSIVSRISGMTGQTGDLMQWQAPTFGTAFAGITATGQLYFGSTSNGMALYNTVDQTVNYERVRMYWNTNQFTIGIDNGGTGVSRTARYYLNSTAYLDGATAGQITLSGAASAAAGIQTPVSITPTINQTATAGYTALLVNPTQTAVGTGTKLLADFQVGGVSKLNIDNKGKINVPAGGAAGVVGTSTLVAGTVTVATTAVTAASIIMLTVQSLGTVTVAKAQAKGAVVAGTSFVITSADATDTSVIGWMIIN